MTSSNPISAPERLEIDGQGGGHEDDPVAVLAVPVDAGRPSSGRTRAARSAP